MTPIEQFETIFSEDRTKKMISMAFSRLSTGCKTNNALDLIAVGNGYKDYKTAKGLWLKYNKKTQRYWCPIDPDTYELLDEDFNLFNGCKEGYMDAFYEVNKQTKVVELNYCYEIDYINGIPTLPEGCFNKQDVIDIIEKHNAILIGYQSRDCNGNPNFDFLVSNNDLETVKKITAEAYQMTIEDCEKAFGFQENDELQDLKYYLEWRKLSENK